MIHTPRVRGHVGNTKTHKVKRTLTPEQEEEYKKIWKDVKRFEVK